MNLDDHWIMSLNCWNYIQSQLTRTNLSKVHLTTGTVPATLELSLQGVKESQLLQRHCKASWAFHWRQEVLEQNHEVPEGCWHSADMWIHVGLLWCVDFVWDDPNVHDQDGHLKIFDVWVNSGHSMSFSWLGMFHFMLFSRTVRGAFGTPSAISIGGRSSAWRCHWETNGRSVLMELEICSEWWRNILGCVLRGMCTDLQRCCYVRT